MDNKKNSFRRYIDNLYSTDDARSLLDMVRHPENKEMLDSLAEDVWDAASMQPLAGVDYERYKKEGR